jgi:hypothetical protein
VGIASNTNSPKYSYTWAASRGIIICSQNLEKWYNSRRDGR